MQQPANEIIYYDFDEFRIDVAEQRLSKNGKPLALTQKAFSVLLVLVENSGRIVEKEKIISAAWDSQAFVEESNLSQYVYVLRKALGRDPGGNSYIETVTKRGFRFTAPVKPITREASATTAPEAAETRSETPPPDDNTSRQSAAEEKYGESETFEAISVQEKTENETENPRAAVSVSRQEKTTPPKPLPKNRRASAALRFLLIALLFSGLVLAAAVYQKRLVETPNGGNGAKIRSIAVLPFRTVNEESGGAAGDGNGASRSDEKPGLGMADAIITRLNRSRKFQVRSTSAVSNLTDQPDINVRHVGRELAVDAVLEGTVQRHNGGTSGGDEAGGGRMRVTAQLTNVADGRPLWVENYDEPAADIFTIQDTVSEKIAKSLEAKF